jgi:hypothetical protein
MWDAVSCIEELLGPMNFLYETTHVAPDAFIPW